MDAFVRWANERGVKLSQAVEVILRPGRGGGMTGIRARADIAGGEVIAVIPKHACLTSSTSSVAKPIFEAWMEKHKTQLQRENLLRLAVTLMVERMQVRGGATWAPYLAMLPRNEPTLPMLWSLTERRSLVHSSIEDNVAVELEALQQCFENVVRPMLEAGGISPDAFTLDTFMDAATTVWSRAAYFTTDPNPEGGERRDVGEHEDHEAALVPLLDLCNHRARASCNARVLGLTDNSDPHYRTATRTRQVGVYGSRGSGGDGGFAFEAGNIPIPTVVRLQALRAIVAGEEITLPYGCKYRDAPYLLLRYGFLPRPTLPSPATHAHAQPVSAPAVPAASVPAVQGRAPVRLYHQFIDAFVTKHAAAGDNGQKHRKAASELNLGKNRVYIVGADGVVPRELLALLAYTASGQGPGELPCLAASRACALIHVQVPGLLPP